MAVPKTVGQSDTSLSLPTLTLQNGKHSGTIRSLRSAATLVGAGSDCDIRINVDGVLTHHCLVLRTLDGIVVRDLGSAIGTLVNGEPVSSQVLKAGDAVTVGPFEFVLDIPLSWDDDHFTREQLRAERAAHRVQVAAVAAQQIALTQREQELRHQQASLNLQEKQLAEHLEAKRVELAEAHQRLKDERAEAVEEHKERRHQLELEWDELRKARMELDSLLDKVEVEREQVRTLRQRQKARFVEKWKAKAEEIGKREDSLVEKEESLAMEQEQFHDHVLKFNGEIELRRRELEDMHRSITNETEAFDAEKRALDERVRRYDREVEERTAELDGREKRIYEEQRSWETLHTHLQQDLQGLDNRIRHQRTKLAAQEQQLQHAQAVLSPLPSVGTARASARVSFGERPGASERARKLELELSGQRQHLLEQWSGLAKLHHQWQTERAELVAELEARGRELQTLERELAERESAVGSRETAVRDMEQRCERLRTEWEGRSARLRFENQGWLAEREQLLAETSAREQTTATFSEMVQARLERCQKRLSKDVRLATEAQQCGEKQRMRYLVALEGLAKKQEELHEREQRLCQKEQAFEQVRQELLAKTEDSPSADRRIERLARDAQARTAREEKLLREERKILARQRNKLKSATRNLARQNRRLARRQQKLIQAHRIVDENAISLDATLARHEAEVHGFTSQREQDEATIEALRVEIEHLIGVMLEESSSGENLSGAA